MIIDLEKFTAKERPFWSELERELERSEADPSLKRSLPALQRYHYLYERTSADLGKLTTASGEPETRRYLESLVARAYADIHETRQRPHRLEPWTWFFRTLPRTFRRHTRPFLLSLLITVAGMLFGGAATAFDPEAKEAIVPAAFTHLLHDPAERVAREEEAGRRPGAGELSTFSAQLMTNNISVCLKALALGMTFGIGTLVILFYNGILLGLVLTDYILAGQSLFLGGWLLPHGSVEIPAILMGGQSGFVLAGALLGRGQRHPLPHRLRTVARDLVTLVGGLAVLLVWAGLVEAFFSQYHAPTIPYSVKITFGTLQLLLLTAWLGFSGRDS